MLNRNASFTRASALLFIAGVLIASAPIAVNAQTDKPTASDKRDDAVDGVEGDLVQDPESVFNGKRMKNGWKNSAPGVYCIDPEKVILKETSSEKPNE
jgi:hypothetical protein